MKIVVRILKNMLILSKIWMYKRIGLLFVVASCVLYSVDPAIHDVGTQKEVSVPMVFASAQPSRGDWYEVVAGDSIEVFANHVRTQYAVWLYLTMQISEDYSLEISREASKFAGELPRDFGTWFCSVKQQAEAMRCNMVYAPDLYWLVGNLANFESQLVVGANKLEQLKVIISHLKGIFGFVEQYIGVMPEFYERRIGKIVRDCESGFFNRNRALNIIRDLITINYHAMRILLSVLDFYPEKIQNADLPAIIASSELVKCSHCGLYGIVAHSDRTIKEHFRLLPNSKPQLFSKYNDNCPQDVAHSRWYKLWQKEIFLFKYLHTDFRNLCCQRVYQAFALLKATGASVEDKYYNVLNLYESAEDALVVNVENDMTMEDGI